MSGALFGAGSKKFIMKTVIELHESEFMPLIYQSSNHAGDAHAEVPMTETEKQAIDEGRRLCLQMADEKTPEGSTTFVVFAPGSPIIDAKCHVCAHLYTLTDTGRKGLENKRRSLVERLKIAKRACFFGSSSPGSHEYTNEDYFAAQANEYDKKTLPKQIRRLNLFLGKSRNSGI